MSTQGGDGFPQNPKIRSLLDAKKRKADEKPTLGDPDLINLAVLRDPEAVRRETSDANAIKTLNDTRTDPRCTPEAIATEITSFDPNVNLDEKMEHVSHEKWLPNPAHYFVLADEYLKRVDAMAQDIVHSNLNSGSPRIGKDTKAKYYAGARTNFLIRLMRDFRERNDLNEHIVDVAFEYRRRRANNEL